MDEATRTQIILAAVTATGPDDGAGDWATRVAMNASKIAAMTSSNSTVGRCVDQVSECKVFPGVVESIRKEHSSTRGIVVLKTRESMHHPDGREEARTERTDNPIGSAMAKRIQALRGHRVMVWVQLETIGSGDRKVRVIRHVEDLGVEAPGPQSGSAPDVPVEVAAAG